MTELSVGIIDQGAPYNDVLREILDHQGILYRTISSSAEPKKVPLVILPKYSEQAYSVARKACLAESDILVADRILSLDVVLSHLQGKETERRDNLEPDVNKGEEQLLSAIRAGMHERGLPLVRKWYWPRMAKACCVLTHDIDWFEYSPFHKTVAHESLNPIRLARLAYGALVRGKDFGWNIPEVVKLEREFGFKSTFFFRTSYESSDHLLARSAEIVKKEGFEVALHGAHFSHNNLEALHKEITVLREKTGEQTHGLRYHILKLDVPRSWEIHAEGGLEYDATFCHNRFFGFRAGICFPYHPFSTVRLPILELPTAYMDWTSLHRGYGVREQEETLQRVNEAVSAHHGLLMTNFHNTYLNQETFPTVYSTFVSLLKFAKAEQYWVSTALECTRWWVSRSRAEVNPRLDSGQVKCSPSAADVIVEWEKKALQVISSSRTFALIK